MCMSQTNVLHRAAAAVHVACITFFQKMLVVRAELFPRQQRDGHVYLLRDNNFMKITAVSDHYATISAAQSKIHYKTKMLRFSAYDRQCAV